MNIGFLVEVFLELWHWMMSGWRQAPADLLHVRKSICYLVENWMENIGSELMVMKS